MKVNIRRVILALTDAVALMFSCFVTYFLVNLSTIVQVNLRDMYPIVVSFTLFSLLVMIALGVYSNMWRYANVNDFVTCILGVSIGTLGSYLMNLLIGTRISNIYYLTVYLLAICVIVGMRIVYRYVYDIVTVKQHDSTDKKRTLIVGAGQACERLLEEMRRTDCAYRPICIVDDDVNKISRTMHGIRIYGPVAKVPAIVREQGIQTVLLAIPSCSEEERHRIMKICSDVICEVKMVPYLHEIISDATLLHQVKNIRIEDLLGRDAISFDDCNTANLIRGSVCMVTGGGGSIGSELCRQIARYQPKQLVIVDIYENNAYEIQQELLALYQNSLNLSVQIASVRDYNKMNVLMQEFKPEILFHAAAHKHVPLMETNPEEAIKNNVIGTFNVASLADFHHVRKMVLISTDKAVNPTNVMGATKRCCEMVMQYMAQQSTCTEFVAVRFGNVLGSNGSVVPLFRRQIEQGGPVTVTHPDIIRYFMTIPEAVSLVLQAGAMAHGGEIFVLDMGDPVKITTLAENLIRLYGYEPYTEMKISFTGLRPGEKLFEELLMEEEGLKSTANKKIFVGNQIQIDGEEFIKKVSLLKRMAMRNDKDLVVNSLYELVPTFHHEKLTAEKQRLCRLSLQEVEQENTDESQRVRVLLHRG